MNVTKLIHLNEDIAKKITKISGERNISFTSIINEMLAKVVDVELPITKVEIRRNEKKEEMEIKEKKKRKIRAHEKMYNWHSDWVFGHCPENFYFKMRLIYEKKYGELLDEYNQSLPWLPKWNSLPKDIEVKLAEKKKAYEEAIKEGIIKDAHERGDSTEGLFTGDKNE